MCGLGQIPGGIKEESRAPYEYEAGQKEEVEITEEDFFKIFFFHRTSLSNPLQAMTVELGWSKEKGY